MALTDRQLDKIFGAINELQFDFADGTLDTNVFKVAGVKVKVADPKIDGDEISVKFKVIADADEVADLNELLNFVNFIVDGDDGGVIFNDDTPDADITDTFRLTFNTSTSDFDLKDL